MFYVAYTIYIYIKLFYDKYCSNTFLNYCISAKEHIPNSESSPNEWLEQYLRSI